MEKLKTLFTGDYNEQWYQKFDKYFDMERKGFGLATVSIPTMLPEDELIEALQGKEAFLVGYDPITAKVIENCPDLKMIFSIRDGAEENVDVEACTKAGIPVITSAGRCAVSVAEFTFLLMLLLARPMAPVMRKMRNEGWTKDNSKEIRRMHATRNTELFGKNLGIIGYGRNAKTLTPLAKAFGMTINAYDPFVSEEAMNELGVNKMSLEDVVKTADYVIVLARLTKDTQGILSRELIYSMKPTASIVNTGRAKLVDNEAIFDALEEGVIKSAALDVHFPEPLGALDENRVYAIPEEKLILTPHAAGNTLERPDHQYGLLYNQLIGYLDGVVPNGCINKQVFETEAFKNKGGKYFNINNK